MSHGFTTSVILTAYLARARARSDPTSCLVPQVLERSMEESYKLARVEPPMRDRKLFSSLGSPRDPLIWRKSLKAKRVHVGTSYIPIGLVDPPSKRDSEDHVRVL